MVAAAHVRVASASRSPRAQPPRRRRPSRRFPFALTIASALVLVVLSSAQAAHAADGGAATSTAPQDGRDDVRTLEKQLNDESAALSTTDCNAACRALGSIRRAADKICSIEPGARCDAARSKAADATKRVREACPDCAVAAVPSPVPEEAPVRAGAEHAREAPTAMAPPSEEKGRGGCASCDATASRAPFNADAAVIALAVLGISRIFRRGRGSKKDRSHL